MLDHAERFDSAVDVWSTIPKAQMIKLTPDPMDEPKPIEALAFGFDFAGMREIANDSVDCLG
jgi:hypothetical protein